MKKEQTPKGQIWAIVALVGSYIFLQVLADVAATKLVQVGAFVVPAGTFVFAATFTVRDLLHKRLGVEWARACIWAAVFLNLIMAVYLHGVALLPAPSYYGLADAWASIFKLVPWIVIASIVAELVSELIDTEIYHSLQEHAPRDPQWVRVLISNSIALPVDTALFIGLAFYLLPVLFYNEPLPWGAMRGLVMGQVIIKGLITLVSLPTIYLVREREAT